MVTLPDDPTGASPQSRSRLGRWIVFAVILGLLGLLKLSYSVQQGPFGLDASNYFQIARHVAEGRGLQTSVSLYHVGLDPLPQRSPQIYPVWPLLLGWTGRWIGLFQAADLLPKLFYLLDLVLIYFLADRLGRRVWGTSTLWSRRGISFDAGHLFMLLLGLNLMFFSATSHPYTEGVAFALAFGGFLLLDLLDRAPVLAAAGSGLLLSLAFLSRTQMIAAMAGVGMAFLLFAFFHRRLRLPAAAYCVTSGAILFGWWQILYRGWGSVAGTDPYPLWVEQSSLAGFVAERVLGLAVGFAATSPFSYVRLWGLVTYLPPIAAAVFLWRRRKDPLKRFLPSEDDFLLGAIVLAGLVFFASLNLFHGQFFLPWLFGWRHGLPYVFLLMPAIPSLLVDRVRGLRILAMIFVVASLIVGGGRVGGFVTGPEPAGPVPAEKQLLRWLEENHEGTATILTTRAQTLAVFSRDNFHWTTCDSSPEMTRQLIDKLPIDYMLVYEGDLPCPFHSGEILRDVLSHGEVFGAPGGRIFLLRVHRNGADGS